MKAVINIPYPGSVISKNHYKYHNAWFKKKACVAWMEMLGWLVKPYHIEAWLLPITVKVSGTFKDKRSCPDLHNLLVVICDSIEEVTGINDRGYRTETGDAVIDKDKEPELTIEITGGIK